MSRKRFASFLFLFKTVVLLAQSPAGTIGNWLMVFNQSRLHESWSLHTEAQYRSFEIKPNTEQLLLRAGINYHINPSALAGFGYAHIFNYAYDKEISAGVQVIENRLWQQLVMRNNIGKCLFEHRYRLEQRWLQAESTNRYLTRIRYLLRATIPLTKKTIEKNTLFLSFYDEIFIHFTDNPFDRNRLYGAVAFQFLTNANIQLGYLSQTVNVTTKHYLQTAIFYNFDFRKKD